MRFTKMHALGNDFVLVDVREHPIDDPSGFARRFCDRRLGIGADQVLLLDTSESADLRMGIFNADGSEVEMCGNGIRAFAKYVWDRGISDRDPLEVETLAGIIRPSRHGEMVRVDMGEPELDGRKIPVALDGQVVDHPLEIEDRVFEITCVSMGNPHAVIYVEDVEGFPVERYGSRIERHELFPNRINVEFVQVLNESEISMRVWERGAGETLACGTGASASAVASMVKGLAGRRVTVHLPGGDLLIEWPEKGRVYMTGPATEVFEGQIKGEGGRDV
jgi:diaminopimelate epimerase